MIRTRSVALGLAFAVLCGLGAASCGDEPSSTERATDWAKVSAWQTEGAEKLRVPVAFENDLGMRFVLIPAGSYRRTKPHDPADPHAAETWEEVEVTEPFYLQVTEVTNAQYRRFRAAQSSGMYEGLSLDGDQQPVVKVTWQGAMSFASWLTKQDRSRSYRLPTDVEWEYACRARTTTRFPWGESEADALRHANVRDAATSEELGLPEEGALAGDDGHRVTAPVGSYEPNAWGLYDMIGNVWEWCMDTPPSPFPGPSGNLEERPPSNRRIARGGAWTTVGKEIESSARLAVPARLDKAAVLGFRLAIPVTPREGP